MPGLSDYMKAAIAKLDQKRAAAEEWVRRKGEENRVSPERQAAIAAWIAKTKNEAHMYALPKVWEMEKRAPSVITDRVSMTPMTYDPNGINDSQEEEVVDLDKPETSQAQRAIDNIKAVAKGKKKLNFVPK